MDEKQYKRVRAIAAVCIAGIVGAAVSTDNIILASAGVLIGMVVMVVIRSKTKITVDERDRIVREKAAQMAYAIFAPTIGLGSFFLILIGNEENSFLEEIGVMLAYVTLFLMALYAISLYYFNRKYGGDGKQ